jgi:hypothetical protein
LLAAPTIGDYVTPEETSRQEFYRLQNSGFDYTSAAHWDDYYACMSAYLMHPEPDIRRAALERLSTAVMWAEQGSHISAEHSTERLNWLIRLVDEAHVSFGDTASAFLHELRHKGHVQPFDRPLRELLHHWLKKAPKGASPDIIRGTLILLGDCGSTWDKAAPQWLRHLDDPSDYVRGCAAKMLGEFCSIATEPSARQLFALIKPKEIARPGIAGPFWSGRQFDHEGVPDIVEWMMDILEKRSTSEPPEMPYNGVDFFLHELCAGSLDAIERMLRYGQKWLALETATEWPQVVEGMRDILLRLGEDPDTAFAQGAWEHLARYYHCLHPQAKECDAVCAYPNWSPEADAFVIRQGGKTWRDVMVLYPKVRESWDDKTAWGLIDLALPPVVRGELSVYSLAPSGAVGPYRIDSSLDYEFTSGALVTLEGDPDRKVWNRVEIIGRGLQGRWDPRPSSR